MDELLRVNSRQFAKAAEGMKAAPRKLQRIFRKELREEAKPLGKEMTAGLATASSYRGGLADRLRSGVNYTRTVFARDGETVTLAMKLAARHPVFGQPDVWSATNLVGPGSAPEVFDKGVDDLQNKFANRATAMLKETL